MPHDEPAATAETTGVRVGVRVEEWIAPAVVTLLAVWMVLGHYSGEGPTLVSLDDSHGVHLGDLAVLALWLVALAPSAWRWRSRR